MRAEIITRPGAKIINRLTSLKSYISLSNRTGLFISARGQILMQDKTNYSGLKIPVHFRLGLKEVT